MMLIPDCALKEIDLVLFLQDVQQYFQMNCRDVSLVLVQMMIKDMIIALSLW